MSRSILKVTPSEITLDGTGSIPAEWLLSGDPATRSQLLVRSHDWLAHVLMWECGKASYKWHYDQDEAYIVLSGEGFMTDESGMERRFGPGDVAYFPAGTNTTWRHPDHFRKVVFVKESVGRPVGFCLKVWSRLLRVVGITGRLRMLLVLAAWIAGNLRKPPSQ
jgi:uncharacterized cupin superfamily protein